MACSLLLALTSHGQERLQQVRGIRLSRFDQNTARLIRVFDDHYTLSTATGDSAIDHPAPGIGDLVRTHNFHLVRGELLMVQKGSGPVLKVREGRIERIDYSIDHRFQKEAIEFVYHDTLFRHGGYAFWEARNHLSYFSTVTNEWEILQPYNGTEFPPGLFQHQGILTGSDLYLIGGYTLNPYNPFEQVFNNNVWKFSFRDYRWTNLGLLAEELTGSNQLVHQPGLLNGTELFCLHQKGVSFLNPSANTFSNEPKHPSLHSAVDFGLLEYFPYRDHLYFYSARRPFDTAFTIKGLIADLDYMRLPMNVLHDQRISPGTLYHQEQVRWWWSLAALPIVLGGLVVWRRARKPKSERPQASLRKEGVVFMGIEYPLEPAALAVLNLLLTEPGDVTSARIMEFTSKPGLDYPNQVRQKNQVIRSLNLELRSILRTSSDLIVQTEAPNDRRVKCYRIDRSWFTKQPNKA